MERGGRGDGLSRHRRGVRGAGGGGGAEGAAGRRVLLIADGEVGARVRALLAQAGISVEATVPPGHESPGYVAAPPEGGFKPRLVLCVREQAPYRERKSVVS